MNRLIASIYFSLILLPSAFACGAEGCAQIVLPTFSDVAASPVKAVTAGVDAVVDGAKCLTRIVVRAGADLPRHLSHAPRLAMGAGEKASVAANHSMARAKATASEGMNGFSTFSNFLLRIAYSSFSALVSGIWRS